jgi:VanZ family protein
LAGIVLLMSALTGALLPDLPFIDLSRPFQMSDKGLHVLVFVFLAVWFSGQYARQSYWRIGVGLIAFGALIELIQSMVSYRTAEWMDMYADGVGITIGLIIALLGAGGWSLRMERWLEN